jgi:hypothetical protein
MSLLDKASLVVTPNAYKASKLYSVIPSSGAGDMDVVRATTATRVNSAGLIESVAVNVPRIDYTNGSCPSLLVEPQRTNLVFPSATLTTQTRTVTAAPNTLSFYGTGTIVLSGVHIATLTGTGANNRVSLTFTPTAGSLILTVTGTVTNAQLELGSYATSYIPTVASTVTRNADVISKTGISSLIGQTEGTVFIEYYNQLISSTILFLNKNSTNSIAIGTTPTSIQSFVICNGVQFQLLVAGYTVKNQKLKIAISYNSLGYKLFINGILKGTNVNSIIFTAPLTSVNFNDNIVINLNQTIYNNGVQLYKTALTDTECIALTTL